MTDSANTHTKTIDTLTRAHVGRKLMSYLLIFSSIVTLVTSCFILIMDYRHGINEYDEIAEQIRTSYQQSISYSLWNFDTRQIDSQLEGILNFPGVVYAYIETQDNLIHSVGEVLSRTDKRYSFPLNYNNFDIHYQLGELIIDISYSDLYDELKEKTLQILLSQFLKTFSVSLFVLFIVRLIITRRLNIMSAWADRFSLENLDDELILNNHNKKHDELDLVAVAINKMRNTLKQDIVQLNTNRKQLEDTQKRLSMAINNAALGFCHYHSQSDTIICNQHFAALLGSTQPQLKKLPHMMERFRDMIVGEGATEQKEKLNQLIFGRISRLQDYFCLNNMDNNEKFVAASIQVTGYIENRPAEIVICLVDKTHEQQSSRKAKELTINLENKVSKRTEKLYEEQQRAKINIEKLTQQLTRIQQEHSNRLDSRLNHMIFNKLQHNDQAALILIRDYFSCTLNGQLKSIDLSQSIRKWLKKQPQLQHKNIQCAFPLSLIMEENEALIYFLLQCLINEEPALQYSSQLNLKLLLCSNQAKLQIDFLLEEDSADIDLQPNNSDHLELCDFIISSQLQGKLSRQYCTQQLTTTFSLSLTHQQV